MNVMRMLRQPFAALSAGLVIVVTVAGCASSPKDESANWSPEKLYSEAKQDAAAGSYEKAAKLYERLEGRAAGTVLAQQAQIERAYVLYKSGEKAQALAAI